MKATMLCTRSMLRLGLIGLAGLLFVGSYTRSLEAAPELVLPPVPPSLQPMPTPAPLDPGTATPPEKRPSIAPPQDNTAKDGTSPAPRAAQGIPDLNTLFEKLRTAKTEDDAKLVNAMIEVEMLQSGSDTIDLLMFRAVSAVQNQDVPLAMDLLDTVIALKPDYAEGWNKRATLYFMKRDYGKAISDVEMVLRLQPRHYPALIGLAEMLNELGDTKHALEALKRVLMIYPLNSSVAKQVEELQSTVGGRNL